MIPKIHFKVNIYRNKKDRKKRSFLVKYAINYFFLLFIKITDTVISEIIATPRATNRNAGFGSATKIAVGPSAPPMMAMSLCAAYAEIENAVINKQETINKTAFFIFIFHSSRINVNIISTHCQQKPHERSVSR